MNMSENWIGNYVRFRVIMMLSDFFSTISRITEDIGTINNQENRSSASQYLQTK